MLAVPADPVGAHLAEGPVPDVAVFYDGANEINAQSLSAKGVPADHMRTRGAGEAEPVTAAGTCTKGSSAQVIACLQPDRRVDIVVQGTQIAKP